MSSFTEQRQFCLVPRSRQEWLSFGIARDVLRPPLYRRTSRGYFVPMNAGRDHGALTTTQRVLDMSPLVPTTGALGGWAAAFVHGVDWLDGVDRLGEIKVPVHVGSVTGRSGTAARYILDELVEGEVEDRQGLRVTSVGRTAFDVVRWSHDLQDAVAALDAMLRFTSLTLDAYGIELSKRDRWRGVKQARAATELGRVDQVDSGGDR